MFFQPIKNELLREKHVLLLSFKIYIHIFLASQQSKKKCIGFLLRFFFRPLKRFWVFPLSSNILKKKLSNNYKKRKTSQIDDTPCPI